MRILRLPDERLDPLLGDGLTQTIKRVAIGCFNGDGDALFSLIASRFSRSKAGSTLRSSKRFLARFDDERLAPSLDMAWCGWEDAIALLGFRDFVPRVEAAWKDGRTPEGFSDPKYFFSDLKRAEMQWSDPKRFKDEHHLGYIEDIAGELAWIASGDSESGDADARYEQSSWTTPQETYINPLRHIGRNDPCLCGSGKKAKRCCLAG